VQLNAAGQVIGTTLLTRTFGQDAWFYDGTSTVRIGLTGSIYEYTTSSGTKFRLAEVQQLNAGGEVLGKCYLFNSDHHELGADTWVYDGTSTHRIGLTGAGYQYTYTYTGTGGGTARSATAAGLNDAGQAAGDSERYYTNGNSLGSDAWFYDGSASHVIGLTGSGYEFVDVSNGGAFRRSTSVQLNAAGQVLGESDRYNATGTSLGSDVWLYDNATSQTHVIGLTGSGYEYTASGGGTYRESFARQLNDAGQAIGVSTPYNSAGTPIGEDSWIYSGGSTTRIGLTGPDYEYTYTGPGGGTVRGSFPQTINAAGQVAGNTTRVNASGIPLGHDPWVYSGGTTRRVGLVGGVYEFIEGNGGGTSRTSDLLQLNATGQTIGTSDRYAADAEGLGHDAWVDDGTTTQRIGLIGAGHEYTTAIGVVRSSTPLDINAAGQVIGTSARYDASGGDLGNSGWFFDPATSQTTPLEFSFQNTGYSDTTPVILTDAGVVLGEYERFDFFVDEGKRVFLWSPNAGFYDLGAAGQLVQGGLLSSGWAYLTSVYGTDVPGAAARLTPGGAPQYILGTGVQTDPTNPANVFLLTAAVPEPASGASLALVALSAVGCLRRRQFAR
jgi:hypothetical protein